MCRGGGGGSYRYISLGFKHNLNDYYFLLFFLKAFFFAYEPITKCKINN